MWTAPSTAPANIPVGSQGSGAFGGLTVNFNPQGLNVMGQSQVKQGISDALHTTTAPMISGGHPVI
jgi:hypothetical protein